MDGAAAGVSRDQGQASSTTRSAISPGAITITDAAGQQARTGQTAAETVASIHREVRTGDASQGLGKNWDGQQLLQEQAANAQIVASFGQQASRAAGTFADQKALEARISADDVTAQKWEEGGEYRSALHTAIGAITGGPRGAAGAAVSSALLPEVGESIAALNLPEGVRKAVSTVLGTALGAVGVAPGAAAGLNQAANNYLSKSPFAAVRRTVAQENARLTKECELTACTEQGFKRIDQQVVRVEIAANLIAISKISSMTQEQAQQLSQVMLELVPIYGSGESVLQLITGHSSLTGEEASRFWAAVGLIPVAGGALKVVGKPVEKLVDKVINELKTSEKLKNIPRAAPTPIDPQDITAIAEKIPSANRVGSALKNDIEHISASHLSKEQLSAGKVFIITGGDGKERKLLQTSGTLNADPGIYEYIIDQDGNVTHQRFIRNGVINGIPNQRPDTPQ